MGANLHELLGLVDEWTRSLAPRLMQSPIASWAFDSVVKNAKMLLAVWLSS